MMTSKLFACAETMPASAVFALTTSKPPRAMWPFTSLQKPSSSSMIRMRGFRLGIKRARNLDYREEKPKLPYRGCELLIVDRLGDVHVATEIVTPLDFRIIVRRCENDHRRDLEMAVVLEILKDINAGNIRQIQIEQNQDGRHIGGLGLKLVQISICRRAIGKVNNFIGHARTAYIPLDETCVPLVILDHDNRHRLVHAAILF